MVAFDTDQIARVERSWLIAHANHHYAFTAAAGKQRRSLQTSAGNSTVEKQLEENSISSTQ